MQGQLRNEPLSVRIQTECAHCGQAIHFELDSDLQYHDLDEGSDPLVFSPRVDLHHLEDPSIIDAF